MRSRMRRNTPPRGETPRVNIDLLMMLILVVLTLVSAAYIAALATL